MEPNRPLARVLGTPLATHIVMKPCFLILVFLMGPLALHAVECELAKSPIPRTTWENFKVTSDKGNELTLISAGQIPAAIRKEITSLITDEASNFASIAPRAEQMLAANAESFADHASILVTMNDLL